MKKFLALFICSILCITFSNNVFVKGNSLDSPEDLVDKSGIVRKLLWRDEFTGTKLNEKNWNYDLGDESGWGSRVFTTMRKENCIVKDGLLDI